MLLAQTILINVSSASCCGAAGGGWVGRQVVVRKEIAIWLHQRPSASEAIQYRVFVFTTADRVGIDGSLIILLNPGLIVGEIYTSDNRVSLFMVFNGKSKQVLLKVKKFFKINQIN